MTVQYETTGGTWTDITTVTVDENDEYSYVWKPEEAGNYSVRVAWPGDAAVSPAVSPEKDVTVAAAPVDILLYAVIAVVVIVAVVVVVVYFVKMRKP